MIPVTNDNLRTRFEIAELPTNTFKLHTDTNIIAGYVDEREAMKQAIYLILNVERYEHVIYSWNYGVELSGLMGKPVSFCLPEIKRRISEALLQDSRIIKVHNFDFKTIKGQVHVTFEVVTIFGAIEIESAVQI